jgi:hypothetical protein
MLIIPLRPTFLVAVALAAAAGCEPVPVATVQPTSKPAVEPSARAAPTPAPPTYLWAPRPPAGMTVRAPASHADSTSFVLQLANPGQAGVEMTISGGAAVQRPNSRPAEAVTIRSQPGSAYTTGAGWTVVWEEGGQSYEIIALLSLQQVLDAAFRLQLVDLGTWRQRVAAA